MAREACSGCGEETATGSVFYSDRRRIGLEDGGHAYVCSGCDQRIAARRRGTRMTEDELREAIRTSSIAMIAAWPAGNLPPGL
jgi:hypothetical protein